MKIIWNNPETILPEDGEKVLIKTKYLHTEKVRVCRYDQGGFTEKENPVSTIDKDEVWGWVSFEDNNERK